MVPAPVLSSLYRFNGFNSYFLVIYVGRASTEQSARQTSIKKSQEPLKTLVYLDSG